MDTYFKNGLENLISKLAEDKNEWSKRLGYEPKATESDWSISVGKKYTKIMAKQGGVWGFILNEDDDARNFRRGDILKAKSWSTPSLNFPRGSIFEHTDYLPRNIWVGA